MKRTAGSTLSPFAHSHTGFRVPARKKEAVKIARAKRRKAVGFTGSLTACKERGGPCLYKGTSKTVFFILETQVLRLRLAFSDCKRGNQRNTCLVAEAGKECAQLVDALHVCVRIRSPPVVRSFKQRSFAPEEHQAPSEVKEKWQVRNCRLSLTCTRKHEDEN